MGGGTIAGARTTKWAKFPPFVEYANAREGFQEKTPSNIEWAQNRSLPLLTRSGGRLWPPDEAWQVLRAHQPTFQRFLDAIIGSRAKPALITREMMQTLTQHCAHMVLESRWDGSPEKIREREAQADAMKAAASLPAMRDRLAALWSVPASELPFVPPPPKTPPDRYHETSTPSDPLDMVYWDLREFLRRGQPERLRQCPVCQRYFVQVTARAQTYCDTPCRLKANATQPERNAAYVRRNREKQIRADLSKVREAKARLRAEGEKTLKLEWVLEQADITRRRYNTLRQWEQKHYGKARATALP